MITYEESVAERSEAVLSEDVPLQTIQCSFEQICADEEPWIALGNFMHQFFGCNKHRRDELMLDPIRMPEHPTPEQLRWAVFCAASVEYLSKEYELSSPEWALQPHYMLEDPWFYGIGADLPQVQEKLKTTTPEAFTKRNIFCGDRIFRNKYEHEGRQGRRRRIA